VAWGGVVACLRLVLFVLMNSSQSLLEMAHEDWEDGCAENPRAAWGSKVEKTGHGGASLAE
jgi:hypothetical protein